MKACVKIGVILLIGCVRVATCQGFVNLTFEHPLVLPGGAPLLAADGIPHWTAYMGSTPQEYIGYNSISLGGGGVFLEDTNAPSYAPYPLQGIYSVYLEGSIYPAGGGLSSAAVGQTGRIPNSARTLVFWADYLFEVTFAGQPLNCVITGIILNRSHSRTRDAEFDCSGGLSNFVVLRSPAARLKDCRLIP